MKKTNKQKIFQQERYLLPGVSMHLKFQLTPLALHLFCNSAAQVNTANQGHFETQTHMHKGGWGRETNISKWILFTK